MNNKIIAPILTENKVNSIAEKYCKKYNLNGSLAYKITAIKFLPDGMKSYGLDIPLWMVVRDVKGWDDMEITIFISDKNSEVLCCSNIWSPVYRPHQADL